MGWRPRKSKYDKVWDDAARRLNKWVKAKKRKGDLPPGCALLLSLVVGVGVIILVVI